VNLAVERVCLEPVSATIPCFAGLQIELHWRLFEAFGCKQRQIVGYVDGADCQPADAAIVGVNSSR
jgi:hypothetical protein